MNIFVTSYCPVESAQYLDDKRVIKMTTESAQMLSTAVRSYGVDQPDLYKMTHVNHPCSVWARISRANYRWLLSHFKALCNEYTKRYGKTHKSERLYPVLSRCSVYIDDGLLTEFANCAANKTLQLSFKHLEVTEAYREYLKVRWQHDKRPPTWKGSGTGMVGFQEYAEVFNG